MSSVCQQNAAFHMPVTIQSTHTSQCDDMTQPKYRYAVLTPGILTPEPSPISSRMVLSSFMFQICQSLSCGAICDRCEACLLVRVCDGAKQVGTVHRPPKSDSFPDCKFMNKSAQWSFLCRTRTASPIGRSHWQTTASHAQTTRSRS